MKILPINNSSNDTLTTDKKAQASQDICSKHNPPIDNVKEHYLQASVELKKMNVSMENIDIEFVKNLEQAIEKVKPKCLDYTPAHTYFIVYLLNLNIQLNHIDKYLPSDYYDQAN